MTIGLGILLIIVGLVFAFDVINADTSAVDEEALGWILVLGGILAIDLWAGDRLDANPRTGTRRGTPRTVRPWWRSDASTTRRCESVRRRTHR